MSETSEDPADESILYEVLEYFVRKQEPEVVKLKNDSLVLPTTGTIKNGLRYLNNRYSLPESISQQINDTLPWKFAISDKGSMLAILQENIIEIRKSKDEYSSVIGKASAPKDAFPQWRRLVWSPDGLILALASSNGYISFYNSFGNNIFNISPKSLSQSLDILEAGDAIASMIFKKPRVKSETWDYEFIKVSYSGLLKSFCISGNGFSENHEFSFGNFYRNGVNSVQYSEKHNLFFVAGNNINQTLTCIASEIGLTCWRTLNNHPYYKLAVSSQDSELLKSQFSIWNLIPVIKNRPQSLIFKISISPNNQLISCLHTDGTISIWSLPSLKMQSQWKLSEQPEYNIVNPLKIVKLKKSLNNISEFQPVDVGWWSNNALIIARYSGLISVCSINSLKNLLGTSPEFLYTYPQLSELEEAKGFLCLDCEVNTTSTKRSREADNKGQASDLSSDDEKEEDEPKPTVLNYTTNLMKSALYLITDIEKFQPRRKKSMVFHRKYRLIGIKSTTPEDLYSRKIALEQYEEALALAKTYNLDLDLVYQTQWRKSEFSIIDLQQYLSKVSKRSVVLNECLSRVPETLEATRELLNFGLLGANLETLVAVGISDDGKFTPADDEDEDELDENNVQLKKVQKINETLDSISSSGLNESQKELVRFRKNILDHLDKLQTYEILLESSNKFDKKFYEEFRQRSPLENAIKFAKGGNYQGVATMFTYYGEKLIPHWLAIISYFPETLDPEKYQKLLPECDYEGCLLLLYQQELRQKDWVERSLFSEIINLESDEDANFIYESRRSLLVYRNSELTQELLQKWYVDRAYEIERECRLVDNALTLINIGKSHNIIGLESILFKLEVLDDLVYKVGHEDLTLTEIEKLNDLEKIKLLMIKSNEKNFINNIKCMLLPYSRRKKRYLNETCSKDLLREYLLYLSKDDLLLPVVFFDYLKSFDPEILDAIEDVTLLAMDCIYVCSNEEMYSKAKVIFDVIEPHASGREDDYVKYKELEKELKTLLVLSKYEVKVPLYLIRESKQDLFNAKTLLIQMSENLIKLFPQPNEKNWGMLLNDMLDIQKLTFECLDVESCYEISMMARLKSRSKPAIQGCTNLMDMKKSCRSQLKVSYERSIDFILQASNDYFNNSKSLTDPDMELAKECLNLITDDDARIKEEYDLIQSLQILNEFHIQILPLQVRKTSNKMNFIEDCLDSQKDAYKKKQKLLNLANYLRIEKKNNKLREGKVLNLIANKAFELKDYNFCSANIEQMMKNNYHSAWNIAMDLACCDDYSDLKFRHKCIWFAIHNGPSNTLENSLKRANLLQIQILNADLEKWIPPDEESNENLKIEEESQIQNLFKAQTEDKEFVPKIVQTSTELMKSSAQMVTQSTFDLLKNARNTDFWKSKLNFNFIENPQKTIASNEIIEKKSIEELQNFPCFYETLNEDFGISNLDTKYVKYSTDDWNVKLQLCKTLLRISLLSETASYGAEISDINHLLLECAEYTLPEDSSMGLSYLLNLNDDCFMDAIDLFKSFPQTELYNQTLAYFCSLKLYTKKINSDSNDAFMYDPIELTRYMSKVEVMSDDIYMKKLKEEINYLIKNKQEKIHKTTRDLGTSNKNNFEPKLEESIAVKDEQTLDSWDDWGEETSIESEATSAQKSSDDKFSANEAGNWGDRNEDSDLIQTEQLASGDSVPEKSIDKFKIDGDIAKTKIDESDDWGGWGDETMENINEIALMIEKNSGEKPKVSEEKLGVEIVNASGDWGDWDDDTEPKVATKSTSASELEKHSDAQLELNKNVSPELKNDWDSNWSDDWEVSNSKPQSNSVKEDFDSQVDVLEIDVPIEIQCKIFEEEFSKIENIGQYKTVKNMLIQCPEIRSLSSSDDADGNVVLKMITKVVNISENNGEGVFKEIKDMLNEEMIPADVLVKFLTDERNKFTLEQSIYMKLCSKDLSLQHHAIDEIKENYKNLSLNSAIYEEIFFNNLTSSFSVSHDLYYKILEEVFVNRTLSEIEDNVKFLIENLIDQKNIPHAVALLNQLEGIPSSLSTYENCFKLLLRR